MKYLEITIVLFILSTKLFSQHLPLKIGNEWYYLGGYAPVLSHAAIAVDTIRIEDTLYYKIEYREENSNNLIKVTYDRLDGDSVYYRIFNGKRKLIINFNWPVNTTIQHDSINDCSWSRTLIEIKKYSNPSWNIDSTNYYQFKDIIVCNGDTLITLGYLGPEYSKYLGCLQADDGTLIGAKINEITYGTVIITPVELISFSGITQNNLVQLKWSTATESNNYGFEIYRNNISDRNSPTKQIGFTKGKGSAVERTDYEFWDTDLISGRYKYQLIQIDYDGTRKIIAETEVTIIIPKQYRLSQNYPNPFNPSTTIAFQIPKESHVYIKIFDCLGNEIKTLVNEIKMEGSYAVKFDASNLSNGLYFYQMSADNFISTKKMLLIK